MFSLLFFSFCICKYSYWPDVSTLAESFSKTFFICFCFTILLHQNECALKCNCCHIVRDGLVVIKKHGDSKMVNRRVWPLYSHMAFMTKEIFRSTIQNFEKMLNLCRHFARQVCHMIDINLPNVMSHKPF